MRAAAGELNLAALMKATRMIGPGLRDGIWVQGCRIGCAGCANQSYLAHEPRVRMPIGRLVGHFWMRQGMIDGISVLGGEPTEQPAAVAALLRGVQSLGMTTVVFSGRTHEQLLRDPTCVELLAHTDLLIDGPYVAALRDPSLHWRGSRNQRLLRLSDRFTEADLEPPRANGEILLSVGKILFHGIGTQRLVQSE